MMDDGRVLALGALIIGTGVMAAAKSKGSRLTDEEFGNLHDRLGRKAVERMAKRLDVPPEALLEAMMEMLG